MHSSVVPQKLTLNVTRLMMVPFVKETTDADGQKTLGAVALGFLLSHKGGKYVITAGHVAKESEELGIQFKSGTIWLKDEIANPELGWSYHDDEVIDLAALRLKPDGKYEGKIFLPEEQLIPSTSINLGDDVIFGSLPLLKPDPIVLRRGMVAHIQQEGFVIDGQVFPGSSGSPAFLYERPLKFVGIVVAYVPYKDVAVSQQTGETRVVFVENSGLGHVHTTDSVLELLKRAT